MQSQGSGVRGRGPGVRTPALIYSACFPAPAWSHKHLNCIFCSATPPLHLSAALLDPPLLVCCVTRLLILRPTLLWKEVKREECSISWSFEGKA